VTSLPDGAVTLRRLNAETAEQAMRDPYTFRASAASAAVDGGALRLTLAPFEIVRIDGS
jgi:hypothetical protein